MPNTLKLASICMNTRSDKRVNIDKAVRLVREAKSGGADWVLLPEIFAFHGDYAKLYDMAESEDGPLNQELAGLARELKIVLFAGSVGERPGVGEGSSGSLLNSSGQKRVYNTMYIFDREGRKIGKYRKTHLFNLIGQGGNPLYCEPEGFIAGDQLLTLEIDGLTVGCAICYDLRFPGLFQKLRESAKILDVLVIPSAFTKKTGEAHWELLLRARAVELQSYVYASNQCGEHAPGKESFGHSMIIDPWGIKLADTGDSEGIATAALDKSRLNQVREQLPALKNRRPELY